MIRIESEVTETGGTYVDFLTEEEGHDRMRAAYRTNHPRLPSREYDDVRRRTLEDSSSTGMHPWSEQHATIVMPSSR